ncbi:hypothetical protein PLICRDRAFT_44591 [Plicaturopsis crispa FD-325 SS-3]|nr:hypothetical protein PLICRDRAFT_44591 [Plicaturopsis crispa FD-325 SS-3]
MREPNLLRKFMPRMEWGPRNLWILMKRSEGESTTFTRTSDSLFKQRWKSKALVRAYHGDFIGETVFKRWYLPALLPDVRPRRPVGDDRSLLQRFAMREKVRHGEEEEKGMAPVGSLMFSEVERRMDIFLFRCCFVHSVYEARRLIIHGKVLLNGKKHQNSNTRLAPGDMVSVDPEAIRFIKPKFGEQPTKQVTEAPKATKATSEEATSEQSGKAVEGKATGDDMEAPASGNEQALTPFSLPPYSSPFLFIPAYIEVSFATCSAIYLRHPTARPGYSEIPTPYDADGEVIRLAWEWYSAVRPRIRSKRQLAREPENRQRSLSVFSRRFMIRR